MAIYTGSQRKNSAKVKKGADKEKMSASGGEL